MEYKFNKPIIVKTKNLNYNNVIRVKVTKLNINYVDLYFDNGLGVCVKESDILNLSDIYGI